MTNEEQKPKEEEAKEESELSPLDEARAIRDEIVKAKDELKAENEKKAKLEADDLLSSSAGGHIEVKQISPEEQASRDRIKAVGLAGGAQWAKNMDKPEDKQDAK